MKYIERLNPDGVIIVNQITASVNDVDTVIAEEREAYGNWPSDRQRLIDNEPENLVDAIMIIFGESPTIEEPEVTE